MDYKQKYLKYKQKYLILKDNFNGGIIDYKNPNNIIKNIEYIIDFINSNQNFEVKSGVNTYVIRKILYNKNNILIIQNKENYNNSNQNKISIYITTTGNIDVLEGLYETTNAKGEKSLTIHSLEIPKHWESIIEDISSIIKFILIKQNLSDNDKLQKLLFIPQKLIDDSTPIDIDYYNLLMYEFNKFRIHESIGLDDINMDIYNFIKSKYSLTYEAANKIIIDILSKYKNKTSVFIHSFNGYTQFIVDANGAMATFTKTITSSSYEEIINFALSLICIIVEGNIRNIMEPILYIYNNYTNSQIEHKHNQQKIYNTTKIFKTKKLDQNFLQWFVMSINPMLFFVPANNIEDVTLTHTDIKENIIKCFILYNTINLFLKSNSIKSENLYMQKILFTPFNSDIDFNSYIEQIKKEQNDCTLNRFPNNDDGFSSSTEKDMLNIRMLNELYGHHYLDTRHFLTILFGSTSPDYRKNLRDIIPEIITKINSSNIMDKLQYFSRLKIARFEAVKLGDCIDKYELDWNIKFIYEINPKKISELPRDNEYFNIICNLHKQRFCEYKKYGYINFIEQNIIMRYDKKLNITIFIIADKKIKIDEYTPNIEDKYLDKLNLIKSNIQKYLN